MKKIWTFLLKMLGETPAILLAVFLALVVNDCNENRKDHLLANKSLEALHAELQNNQEAILNNVSVNEEEAKSMRLDLDSLQQLGIENLDGISIGITQAIIQASAWDMAILSGATRYFEPEVLRKLTTVYSLQELYEEVTVNYFKELSSVEFYRPGIEKERLQATLQVHALSKNIATQLSDLYSTLIPLVESQIEQ